MKKGKYSKSRSFKLSLSILGLILCAIFSLTLICNLVIIVKGALFPDRPPSIFGITPMVVLSGSMSGTQDGHIEIGDLVLIGNARPEKMAPGDVIAFMEGSIVVTHRILETQTAQDGGIQWITKGDANNAADVLPVHQRDLVGIYRFRIPYVGNLALFLQEPLGMTIFIGLPVLAFLAYDILHRQKRSNHQQKKQAELEAELARLRALAGENET